MAKLNDLTGKVCVVTGATQGIGLATAVALARLNADLTLIVRDKGRGEAALAQVAAAGGNGKRELLLADLSALGSVRAVAAELRARHSRLDVLVNNAGGIFFQRELTEDGLERTFALNHLAYFLLTDLLLDLLKASAPSRIVNVSSAAHRAGRMDFDDPMGERRYSGW